MACQLQSTHTKFATRQICTRLPSPELAFQSGHPIPGCFLPEAIESGDHNFLSPLAECAVTVTICGRALSHSNVAGVERAFGNPSLDFWIRHEWVDGILTRTVNSISLNAPVVSAMADPMMFFAIMVAHATTILMCQIAETSAMDDQSRTKVSEYQLRAMQSAQEIARMAKAHEHIGYFKVRHAHSVVCLHQFRHMKSMLCACARLTQAARGIGPHIHATSCLLRRITAGSGPQKAVRGPLYLSKSLAPDRREINT